MGSGFWVLGSGFWVLGSGFWKTKYEDKKHQKMEELNNPVSLRISSLRTASTTFK